MIPLHRFEEDESMQIVYKWNINMMYGCVTSEFVGGSK